MIFSFYIKIIHNVIKNHKISYTITLKTIYFQRFNAKKRGKRYNYKKKINFALHTNIIHNYEFITNILV